MVYIPLSFALVGNVYQTEKSAFVQDVVDSLRAHQATVRIEREYHKFLKKQMGLTLEDCDVFDAAEIDADYVVSLGGDGTFLKTAAMVGNRQIPILGVNMGRLGFLAAVSPATIREAVDAIYANDFITEEHTVIGVRAFGHELQGMPFALNDIAVLKRDNASMISIRTCINGEYLATYQADGLIVSTPTGSTAYSLSNGGPIMAPSSGNLCLTPVAPHSLNIRPIVISDASEVTLTVESRSHHFLIAVDGRSEKCEEGIRLTIRKAPYKVRIVKPRSARYFSTLREKMSWGLDSR